MLGWSETAYQLDWLHTFVVCGPCDAFHASLSTHQFSGAGEGSMLIAPVAVLVEKIGSVQVPEVVGGSVTGGKVVGGSVIDGTVVVVGGSVTGTGVAGGSLSGGVVVVDAATW